LVNKHAQSHCFVLNGCETWSLTLRRVHRLSMLKNRLMMKIGYLGLRGSERVRKLHDEELHVTYAQILGRDG